MTPTPSPSPLSSFLPPNGSSLSSANGVSCSSTTFPINVQTSGFIFDVFVMLHGLHHILRSSYQLVQRSKDFLNVLCIELDIWHGILNQHWPFWRVDITFLHRKQVSVLIESIWSYDIEAGVYALFKILHGEPNLIRGWCHVRFWFFSRDWGRNPPGISPMIWHATHDQIQKRKIQNSIIAFGRFLKYLWAPCWASAYRLKILS